MIIATTILAHKFVHFWFIDERGVKKIVNISSEKDAQKCLKTWKPKFDDHGH